MTSIESLAKEYYIKLNEANKYSDNYTTKDKTIRDFKAGWNKCKETLYTEEQVREVIDMSRQTKEVDGIRFPIPKYTEQEIIDTINKN